MITGLTILFIALVVASIACFWSAWRMDRANERDRAQRSAKFSDDLRETMARYDDIYKEQCRVHDGLGN